MGSSKKHKDKDREHRHRHKRRSKSRSRSKSRDRERKRQKEEEKRRRRDLENYPDIRIASSLVKQEPRDDSVRAGSSRGGGGGGSDMSLNIEETNKLRAKLGLKPLEIPDYPAAAGKKEKGEDDDEDVHAPPINLAALKKTEDMKLKLAQIREKRRINQKLGKIKTLGESDSDDDSALAWVKKNRKLEKEKQMAEKRAKMLEEMDAEFGVDGLVAEEFKDTEKRYTSKDLAGLKVEHSLERFQEGRTVILTLKDQGVLEDGDETLVNYNIIDDEKAKKNIENKKRRPDYQPVDEADVDEYGMFKAQKVLKKYDDEIEGEKRENFQLGTGGKYNAEQDRQLEKIRASLRQQSQSLQGPALAVAGEYLTPDEMEFKKVKKKVRKIRKKPKALKADDLLPLGYEGMDHGTRGRGRRALEIEEDLPQIPGLGDFDEPKPEPEEEMEVEEAEILGPDEDLTNVKVEEDEAQLELQLALNKTRKLKQKKDLSVPEKIAEKIHTEKMMEEDYDDEEEEEPSSSYSRNEKQNIILNDTSEFCRSLGDIPTYGLAGNRDEERDELLDFELELMQERKRREAEDEIQSGWAAVEIDDRPVNIQEEEPPVLEEEPVVTQGMSGALTVAKKKGYLNTESKKMAVAAKNTDIHAQNYSIEDKRYDDLDEKFRKRDRFCGGMITDFKEKDSYRPDVKLQYVDDSGRSLNPKEAFKQLSYRFHGKGSGKKKTEKVMKKLQEEQLMKQMSSTDTPLGTVAMLQEKQKQEKMPFIVLSGGGKTLTSIMK